MEIEEHNGRVMISPQSDSREPVFYVLYAYEFYIDLYIWPKINAQGEAIVEEAG